ncbi:glucosamine-6-phosphate deaminase [Priestia megaterium]|uniref:glucosamine-6-phosphate deaminase n=1 Tax=Priestia megaterium TaxID=1404 RepID=UPI00366B65B5
MEVLIYEDYNEMSKQSADMVIKVVNEKPGALLCIAAGNTPTGTLRYLVEEEKHGKVDFSNCKFVGLDEWVGMDRDDEGSCQHYLYSEFFNPLTIKQENIYFFDAKAEDLVEECKTIDTFLEEHGPIDVCILGLGMNGHLGLNEPGTPFNLKSHIVDLDNTTKTVGQKYFNETTELSQGITLGCQHFLNAQLVMLQVNGTKKSEVIKKLMEKEISTELPGTVLKQHANSLLLLDKEAASKL